MKKTVLSGGGTRRGTRPAFSLVPPEGFRLTALRFGAGAAIHGEFNWMQSVQTEQDAYLWARSAYDHMFEHVIRMPLGDHDSEPGGNLGAIGWCVAVLAHIEAKFGKPWTELRPEGEPGAPILFGEAPGREEKKVGRPLVGRRSNRR